MNRIETSRIIGTQNRRRTIFLQISKQTIYEPKVFKIERDGTQTRVEQKQNGKEN